MYVLYEDFYITSDCTCFPLRHLYLDEVSAYAVIVCGGDRVFMLRNKLQTVQHFVLRPTEIWTAQIHTHTCYDIWLSERHNTFVSLSVSVLLLCLPLPPCSRYINRNVFPCCTSLSSPSGVAAQPTPTFIKNTEPPLFCRYSELAQPAAG